MISEPRHPLLLNKAACAFLPIVVVLLGFLFCFVCLSFQQSISKCKVGDQGELGAARARANADHAALVAPAGVRSPEVFS